jgi:hypothetical protein
VISSSGSAPARFELRGAAPNPFGRLGTTISYSIPAEANVSLVVYNAVGQAVATLVQERQGPGPYAVHFPAGEIGAGAGSRGALSSGIYFYRLSAGHLAQTKRMVYLR